MSIFWQQVGQQSTCTLRFCSFPVRRLSCQHFFLYWRYRWKAIYQIYHCFDKSSSHVIITSSLNYLPPGFMAHVSRPHAWISILQYISYHEKKYFRACKVCQLFANSAKVFLKIMFSGHKLNQQLCGFMSA